MKFTARQLADLVQGEIIGNEQIEVWSVAKIEESKAGDICFLANEKYIQHLANANASLILISKQLVPEQPIQSTMIVVEDAYASFAKLLTIYEQATQIKPLAIIEQPSFVSSKAVIGENVYIGAFAYIGDDAVIGDNVQIYPNTYVGHGVKIAANSIVNAGVKIYKHCTLGERVIIHSGTVIGSDGFGFAFEEGAFKKIPQIGNVIIEDDVEIGANCTIDRATMGSTIIRKGAKLDNLIQIAHNVEIGENTVVAAQAGIAGSTKVGNYCMIGGQAGLVGHIKIADGTKINAQSGVAKEIKQPGQSFTGSPAHDYKPMIKSQIIFRNLPDLQTRVNQLEHELAHLKQNLTK